MLEDEEECLSEEEIFKSEYETTSELVNELLILILPDYGCGDISIHNNISRAIEKLKRLFNRELSITPFLENAINTGDYTQRKIMIAFIIELTRQLGVKPGRMSMFQQYAFFKLTSTHNPEGEVRINLTSI